MTRFKDYTNNTINGTDYDIITINGVKVFDKTNPFPESAEKAKLNDNQFIVELEPSKLVLDNISGTPSFEKASSIDYHYPYKYTTQSSKYSWYADIDPQTYLKQRFITNGNITASGSIRGAIITRYSTSIYHNHDRSSIYIWDKTTKQGDLKINSTRLNSLSLEYYNFTDKAWTLLGTFTLYGNYKGRLNYNYKLDTALTAKQLEISTVKANHSPSLWLRFTKIT